jgi:VRR-NUC domain
MNPTAQPEAAALELAEAEGWRGTTCEGRAALLLLKAGILHFLEEHTPFGGDSVLTQFLEGQILSYQRDRIGEFGADVAPRNAMYGPLDLDRWERSLRRLLTNQVVQSRCPGLTTELGMDLVGAVGRERWFLIAEVLCRDPYLYRKGWPDLLLMDRDDRVLAVEVKTTDRLHASQIRTIPALRYEVGLPIEVWRLNQAR